jgi:hypothetical protein
MDINSILGVFSPQKIKELLLKLLDDNSILKKENSDLKSKLEAAEDQLRRLQGEKPKPKFSDPKNKDRTSDKPKPEEKDKKDRSPRRQKSDLEIDQKIPVPAPEDKLDASFEYKGTRDVIIQEIEFKRNNICFELEKYYSSVLGKTVEGEIPPEYQGSEFGPKLRAFIVHLSIHGDLSHKKIKTFLSGIGIEISVASINSILLSVPSDLKTELTDQCDRAVKKFNYQHIDDTGARVLGFASFYTYLVSNPGFSWFKSSFSKARWAAVLALTRQNKKLYQLNSRALEVMWGMHPSLKMKLLLQENLNSRIWNEIEVEEFIKYLELSPYQERDLKTSMLIGAMEAGLLGSVGKTLLSDDGSNFKELLPSHSLCWVHELRHYKLLPTDNEVHSELLNWFIKEAWGFVELIESYQKIPTEEKHNLIFTEIERIFKSKSGWRLLDKQKKLTLEKIDKLLTPLHELIPTDNNLAERDLRPRVIKRKISLYNRSLKGINALDEWYSIRGTCQKLKINFWKYLEDRYSMRFEIPRLVEIPMV